MASWFCAGGLGCVENLSAPSLAQGSSLNARGDALSVPDVVGNRDAYAGERIRVFGRLHVQPRALEDAPDTARAERYPASLHLVNPSQPTGPLNLLDLYRRTADGGYDPLTCTMAAGRLVDCGTFSPDALLTVAGTWVRHQMPYGQVGSTVFSWRTVYFLAVE